MEEFFNSLGNARNKARKFRPIAHFAGCNLAQKPIPTNVLRDSKVSGQKSMVENAQ